MRNAIWELFTALRLPPRAELVVEVAVTIVAVVALMVLFLLAVSQ